MQSIDGRNKAEDRAEIIFSSTSPALQRQMEQTTAGLMECARRRIANLSEGNKQILNEFLHEITYRESGTEISRTVRYWGCSMPTTKGKEVRQSRAVEDLEGKKHDGSHYSRV